MSTDARPLQEPLPPASFTTVDEHTFRVPGIHRDSYVQLEFLNDEQVAVSAVGHPALDEQGLRGLLMIAASARARVKATAAPEGHTAEEDGDA